MPKRGNCVNGTESRNRGALVREGNTASGALRLAYRLEEVAGALGVCRRTIERERASGRFPSPDVKIGKAPLWTPETLKQWVASGGKGR